jgi:hypothetical protein
VVIDLLDLDGERELQLAEDDRERTRVKAGDGVSAVVDRLDERRLEIRWIRMRPPASETLRVGVAGVVWTWLAPGWGRVARVSTGEMPRTLWLPREPRRLEGADPAGRRVVAPARDDEQRGAASEAIWRLGGSTPTSWWSLPLVVFDDPAEDRLRELQRLAACSGPSLRKSEWFCADSPSDLWDALVDGAVFDPRACVGSKRRFRCQQCALAWWSYLQIAALLRDSPMCRDLATLVAWTVRAQLEEPAGWRHGYWREQPELHLRFYHDGVNLLLREAGASGEGAWVAAADRAMRHAVEHFADPLPEGGLWLLHDSLEADGELPPNAPPALGQSPGNCLVLNTHLQGLATLLRLARMQPDAESGWARESYGRGLETLRRMLALDTAPALYRGLGRFVPAVVDSRGAAGLRARVTRGLGLRLLRGPYWRVRRRHPRFVYPNGYTERDLTSTMLPDQYHVLNVKDLLVLHALDPQPWLEAVVAAGVGFLRRLDLARALSRSPNFVESVEVYRLYAELFDASSADEVDRARATVRAVCGGDSLDDVFATTVGAERADGPQSLP